MIPQSVQTWYRCKGRHFSLLHHLQHPTKHRSWHVIQANHANPFPTYFHFRFPSKSMQIHFTHLTLFCYTVIYRYWPTHVEIPIFHSVISYLGNARLIHHFVRRSLGSYICFLLTVLNGNWRPTCSDLHINMYCRPSYNVLFIYLFLLSGALGRILFVKGNKKVLWYWYYWYWYFRVWSGTLIFHRSLKFWVATKLWMMLNC